MKFDNIMIKLGIYLDFEIYLAICIMTIHYSQRKKLCLLSNSNSKVSALVMNVKLLFISYNVQT